MVVELGMQCCGQILWDSFETCVIPKSTIKIIESYLIIIVSIISHYSHKYSADFLEILLKKPNLNNLYICEQIHRK